MGRSDIAQLIALQVAWSNSRRVADRDRSEHRGESTSSRIVGAAVTQGIENIKCGARTASSNTDELIRSVVLTDQNVSDTEDIRALCFDGETRHQCYKDQERNCSKTALTRSLCHQLCPLFPKHAKH